jgi:hypothetical protein
VLVLEVQFSSQVFRTATITPAFPTMEDKITRDYGEDSYFPLVPHSPEERLVTAEAMRVAVNSMLLLMQQGCKHLGPANESLYRRLQHYLEMARKRGEGIAEAQRALRIVPQLYGFDQEIVRHEEVREGSGSRGDGDGPPVRPHWRRGHWKMQPYGPGRSERKRILIKPILVNKHLMDGGDGWWFQTTYRMR